MATRVVLADDSEAFRTELRALLEQESFEVVGAASNGREAIDLALQLDPEVLILDHAMPPLSGLDVARAIHRARPAIRLVFLTRHGAEHLIIAAFRAGTRGFVIKPDFADLPRAIREVANGRVFLSPGACAALMDPYLDSPANSHPSRW